MKSDGKQLEGLVSYVEQALLPQGFQVSVNELIVDENGIQVAEFDITITGKVGSTDFSWLIECRDRPSQGPAPGSWIEQLVGRRDRFGFHKVTAVSTSGFAKPAVDYAQESGIEIREVRSLDPSEFSSWLAIETFSFIERKGHLEHVSVVCAQEITPQQHEAIKSIIPTFKADHKFLKSCKSGELVNTLQAFETAISNLHGIYDNPSTEPQKIQLKVDYPNDDDHFIVTTPHGDVRVRELLFQGKVTITEKLVPLQLTAEYRQADSGDVISQVAAFAPHNINGSMFSVEFHRMSASGETHVILRKV